jgi:[protein-PII] uridylyltransferase
VSWSQRRDEVLHRTDHRGADLCPVLTTVADVWLTELFETATGEDPSGLALLAVGGHGRRELCPGSDFDLVLLHQGRSDVQAVADALWYPIWDAGVRLDHAVRRPAEAIRAAAEDVRVQLGLLDARLVAGDEAMAADMATQAADLWRRRASQWLPELADQVGRRRAEHGDLAFLLEPDLKEAHGGLRDAEVVAAVAVAVVELAAGVDPDALARARRRLLDVRVELHRAGGRGSDRLLLQQQDEVAAALGVTDADALMAEVAAASRTVAWMADELHALAGRTSATTARPLRRWRRAGGQVAAGQEHTSRVEPGVAVTAQPPEVRLDPDTARPDDPTLPVRLAAVAAERGLRISRAALDQLAPPVVPDPWPPELRQAFVRLLAAGAPAVEAIEALDRHGLLDPLLPEWALVRNRPQRNAYHRFTVDRHLLEAAARAAPLALRSPRPDLLLLGALLHDIGKGSPGDHSTVGRVLADTVAQRMGVDEADRHTLGVLVQHHLLLPDVATRRDLDDPATVAMVADVVGDAPTLDLLAALAEADGLATGPSAWGPWKAGLVADLVSRTRAVLVGATPPPVSPAHEVTDQHRRLIDQSTRLGRSVLVADGAQVTVVAADRPGLLATVAGVLALFGLDVRSADVVGVDGHAVERFVVESTTGRWPDWTRVADDLEAALRGTLPLERRLAERAAAYRPTRPHLLGPGPVTRVAVDPTASTTSTVVDVRTADGIGVLHRLTSAVAACGLDVVSARVSTLGGEVVDAFYVREPTTGGPITDPKRRRQLEQALAGAAVVPREPAGRS